MASALGATSERQPAWSGNFFVVDQLLEAENNAVRAGLLLRLPDAVVASKVVQMQAACREVGFELGSDFLDVRLAHQSAMRDRQGNLPSPIVEQLEYWRRGMVAIAEARP
ncbi:hypothetical protein [Devosia sediminis]|uniref:Uncharacterized protein n=1 Tax=Devosia sediminis TaxID=2798801 RepID=A0A934IWU5_9HYPH|nr:hypothetical protein [Devosia sediminis]MBJ3783389.1 hypothetical protein [Devosia sediminis]